MQLLRVINLTVRLALELGGLGVFAWFGASLSSSMSVRLLLATVFALAVGAFWGLFVSPKAQFSRGLAGQVVLGLVVFLTAAWMLAYNEHQPAAIAYAATAVVSSVLMLVHR